jgi:hypothetical protein
VPEARAAALLPGGRAEEDDAIGPA